MNVLDYVLLGILLLFLFFGYRKGFIRQALSIAGVITAFYLGARYHAPLAGTSIFSSIRERSETAALVISFVGIFLVTAFVTGLLAAAIGRKMKDNAMCGYDRTLGGFLGVAKGVFLLGGIAIALQQFGLPEGTAIGEVIPADAQEKTEGLIAESVLVPHLAKGCLELIALIPQEDLEEITRAYKERLVSGNAENSDDSGSYRLLNLGNRWKVGKASQEKVEPTPATGKTEEANLTPATASEK